MKMMWGVGLCLTTRTCGFSFVNTTGSAATITGNPQNVLIGSYGNLSYWKFVVAGITPVSLALH
jgi:Na+/H+ antiporter NhaD/arsenite permease-like protein